jgi:transcriptional regulator with XRE-family HTH domain
MTRRQKNNLEIGRRIKFYRLKSGLTQQQMAEKLGIAQGQVSDYEAGKVTVPIDLLGYMADMLNVSAAVLDDSLLQIPFFRDGFADCKSPDTEKRIRDSIENFRRRMMDAVMDSDLDPASKSKAYQIIKNLPENE